MHGLRDAALKRLAAHDQKSSSSWEIETNFDVLFGRHDMAQMR